MFFALLLVGGFFKQITGQKGLYIVKVSSSVAYGEKEDAESTGSP